MQVPKMAPESEEDDVYVGYNEWAADGLGITLCTDFVYDVDEDGERGVFIAEDIAPQTQVLSIPLGSLLTTLWVEQQHEDAVYARVLSWVEAQESSPEDGVDVEDDVLATTLLYERFIARDKSKWWRHLQLLPTTYHNALYFTDKEVEMLQGSTVCYIAQQMKTNVDAGFARLKQTLFADIADAVVTHHPERSIEQVEACFSLENYKWALSTIWSRFVSLQIASATFRKAMAPVFDMLNHDPDAEMSHHFDTETQTFQLTSYQHWSAGSQLCINYGALSNHKLLTLYGFVLPENPFDAVEMWLPMDPSSTSEFETKVKLLEEIDVDHEVTPFELTVDELDELLLIVMRIQVLECESSETFQESAQRITNGDSANTENELTALSRLVVIMQQTIQSYAVPSDDPTSKECDGVLHKTPNGVHSLHEHMAQVVRQSDLAILNASIEMLKWRLLDVLPNRQSA
ncbi:hypothetical protein Poli38472_008692 [Pythium oligandrum]|uniref:SET domain-containing protein n=1 Tax=Pythium oligandrum TaxID=41045 RepID=A0A8K1C412_PYTOL|nr:hypothetical protein Poli38472_008692 [Pythium oligandrum]|eukprot:TMW56044.1 hypothetical protein Poli38472_008692 [Pythium oligandrum]